MIIGIDGRAALWYRGTGIGTYVYQLISKMRELGSYNQYHVLFPQNSNHSFIEGDEFGLASENTLRKDKFWEELQLGEVILDIGSNLDIYHIPQNGIGMPRQKSCSFVITLHDVIPLTMPDTVGPYYRRKFIESIPNVLERTDAIITVSEFSKKDICMELEVSPDMVHVTKLAAEDIYAPMDKASSKHFIKNQYGIEKDFFLYVGGFNPRKNIPSLLMAFAYIKSKLSRPFNVVILGKPGPSYDDLMKLCEKLKIVDDCIFTGYIPVPDMPYFYNAAEVFVYPSLYEGFGLPLVEAMACGTPVVTSDITSIPEVVGDAAIKVCPMDYETIGENLLRLIEDRTLYKEMSKRALARAKLYSWDKTAIETLKIYGGQA